MIIFKKLLMIIFQTTNLLTNHNEQKNTYFAFNKITHISKHENSHNVSIDLLGH